MPKANFTLEQLRLLQEVDRMIQEKLKPVWKAVKELQKKQK